MTHERLKSIVGAMPELVTFGLDLDGVEHLGADDNGGQSWLPASSKLTSLSLRLASCDICAPDLLATLAACPNLRTLELELPSGSFGVFHTQKQRDAGDAKGAGTGTDTDLRAEDVAKLVSEFKLEAAPAMSVTLTNHVGAAEYCRRFHGRWTDEEFVARWLPFLRPLRASSSSSSSSSTLQSTMSTAPRATFSAGIASLPVTSEARLEERTAIRDAAVRIHHGERVELASATARAIVRPDGQLDIVASPSRAVTRALRALSGKRL